MKTNKENPFKRVEDKSPFKKKGAPLKNPFGQMNEEKPAFDDMEVDEENEVWEDCEEPQEDIHKSVHFPPQPQASKTFRVQDWSLKNFQLGRPLARGKHGHVILSREVKTKYIVALKMMFKKQLISNETYMRNSQKEYEIHARLCHPNILGLYGCFWEQKKIFFILEWAPHGDLWTSLKKTKYGF